MPPRLKKVLLKTLKYTGISLASFIALLFILPYCFPATIANGVKSWTNNKIDGKVNFSKMHLSFIKHFPSLTLVLNDFSLKGSNPFPADTLVSAKEIAFGINLRSVFFGKSVVINQVYLDNAKLNVQVDSLGAANYNVYIADKNKPAAKSNDTSSASLKIQKIQITNCLLDYHDRSIPMVVHAHGFNYTGTGDLSNSIFDLDSRLDIEGLDFNFDGEDYLVNKKIKADLLTQINTHSLSLLFRRNFLNINKLKLDFTGEFRFLPNGYSLNFTAGTKTIKLYTLITALPPQYLKWLDKTDVQGDANLLFSLKGDYIASQNIKPNVSFSMNIMDGSVAYDKAEPLTDLQFRFHTLLPSLNTDSLRIDLDTLAFKMGADMFDARIHTLGLDSPLIKTYVKADVDLEKIQKAIGYKGADFKGRLKLDVKADGQYISAPDAAGTQVIHTIPAFQVQAAMSNGYFKMGSLPQGINNIAFNIAAACKDGNYRHSSIAISDLKATALANFFQGRISIANLIDYQMDADLHSNVNLAEIKRFVPLDSLELAGLLKLNASVKGRYVPAQKIFPVMKLDMDLKNGSVLTKYYPHPITQIQVAAAINDPSGDAQGLSVDLKPVSFLFEGKPFEIAAALSNFNDLLYDVQAKGELDIEKIYSVFSQKDLAVSGYAKLDVSLAGRQSDATKGRYARLRNSGTLELQQFRIKNSKYLPLPVTITQGLFAFQNDKLQFREFRAIYGGSDFRLNGYLNNVMAYALSDKEKLKGAFTLSSDRILVDEFMPQDAVVVTTPESTKAVVADTSGVIVIPPNLSVTLSSKARSIVYNGLPLSNFSGTLIIDSAKMKVRGTKFNLIGTEMAMDMTYQNLKTETALFDFAIQAKDFDVRKAYNEVKLFHDLAPAAGKARGIVSLDYKLKGRLDKTMGPVYPSLDGGGVLSVRDVQFAGFKLLNSVSRESGRREISDPNVKDVALKTTIRNNVITLEKVKIKMAGFRLRVQGQSTFDKQLSFKMRLGLPPLGIIGIPMTVTGTSENPRVRLGKHEVDSLEEREDSF